MPSKPALDFAALDTWREQGADRFNPLAFHYMAALQKRIATQEGDARRLLGEKLSARIEAYAKELEHVARKTTDSHQANPSTALAELTRELSHRATARNSGIASNDETPRNTLPEMGVLDDARKLWSSVHTRSQVRRSLENSPENAGPLNSSSLVHRSLTLMGEVSPGYLQHFMSYVDALSWLQHMSDHSVLAAKATTQAAAGKPRAPRKPRKRREPA